MSNDESSKRTDLADGLYPSYLGAVIMPLVESSTAGSATATGATKGDASDGSKSGAQSTGQSTSETEKEHTAIDGRGA